MSNIVGVGVEEGLNKCRSVDEFARDCLLQVQELQLKGNLIDCPQIWTVARLTYTKNKTMFANCLFRNIILFRERFLYLTFS